MHAGTFGCPAINSAAELADEPNHYAAQAPSENAAENSESNWVHKWLKTVDETREKQPHYVSPLITTHVLLVQQFRFDSY